MPDSVRSRIDARWNGAERRRHSTKGRGPCIYAARSYLSSVCVGIENIWKVPNSCPHHEVNIFSFFRKGLFAMVRNTLYACDKTQHTQTKTDKPPKIRVGALSRFLAKNWEWWKTTGKWKSWKFSPKPLGPWPLQCLGRPYICGSGFVRNVL